MIFMTHFDSPALWQTYLSDPASITMEGMLIFNKHLLFLLTVMVVFVSWLLFYVVYCVSNEFFMTPKQVSESIQATTLMKPPSTHSNSRYSLQIFINPIEYESLGVKTNTILAMLVPSKYGMFVYGHTHSTLMVPHPLNAESLKKSKAMFCDYMGGRDIEMLSPSECEIWEMSKMKTSYAELAGGGHFIEVKKMQA